MSAMAYQITDVSIVYSIVTGEFPAQRASNAKNVFIWCRHHAIIGLYSTSTELCRGSPLCRVLLCHWAIRAHSAGLIRFHWINHVNSPQSDKTTMERVISYINTIIDMICSQTKLKYNKIMCILDVKSVTNENGFSRHYRTKKNKL